MPKEEWGVKRLCPTSGKRFYDMGRDPIVSPYTGEIVTLDTGKNSRSLVREEKKAAKPEPVEDEAETLIDDEAEDLAVVEADVDLGDDVLDDEDEADEVSLDEIADIASDDDD